MNEKLKDTLTTEKKIAGYRITDLLGIVIMLIPFIISIRFNHIDPGRSFWFVQITRDKTTNIRPGLIPTLLSVVFYISLMLRYEGIFSAKYLFDAIVSSVRAFLNCWVIASLISTIIPTEAVNQSQAVIPAFRDPAMTLLFLAILLSWLGMRTIAGYSWILFIVAAWPNFLMLNDRMNMWGAVYILTFAISLFLQVKDYVTFNNFMVDFCGSLKKHASDVKGEVNTAVDETARVVNQVVKEYVPGLGNVFSGSDGNERQSNKVKINLDSLDVNKDGIVDEKDFMLISQGKRKEDDSE